VRTATYASGKVKTWKLGEGGPIFHSLRAALASQRAQSAPRSVGANSANERAADAEERATDAEERAADSDERAADAEGRLADAEGRLADAEGRLAEAQSKLRAQPALHERESSSLDTAVFGAKWAALYGAISTARQAAERHWKGAVRLTVSRTDVVGTVLQAFDKSCRTTEALLKPLRVKFEGEHGEDEGGLTSELFTLFFAALPHYTVLQTESGPPVCLFERGSDDSTCFLPAAHDHCARRADVYETIGRIVVKALVEERPVPSNIASSFLVDFCLCVEPTHSAKPAASLAEDLRTYGGTGYEWVTSISLGDKLLSDLTVGM